MPDPNSPNSPGGGSGGGVRIDVGTLRGTGQIAAGGGSGDAGGGGGRVAIYHQDISGFNISRITASGGAPGGQNETVHFEKSLASINSDGAPVMTASKETADLNKFR